MNGEELRAKMSSVRRAMKISTIKKGNGKGASSDQRKPLCSSVATRKSSTRAKDRTPKPYRRSVDKGKSIRSNSSRNLNEKKTDKTDQEETKDKRPKESSESSSSEEDEDFTVAPPAPELFSWIEKLSTIEQRSKIERGHRVKVRFGREGWYGGLVTRAMNEGWNIRIKYDDGTFELSSSFPDKDIVVDDERNGTHAVPADLFLPPSRKIQGETQNQLFTQRIRKRPEFFLYSDSEEILTAQPKSRSSRNNAFKDPPIGVRKRVHPKTGEQDEKPKPIRIRKGGRFKKQSSLDDDKGESKDNSKTQTLHQPRKKTLLGDYKEDLKEIPEIQRQVRPRKKIKDIPETSKLDEKGKRKPGQRGKKLSAGIETKMPERNMGPKTQPKRVSYVSGENNIQNSNTTIQDSNTTFERRHPTPKSVGSSSHVILKPETRNSVMSRKRSSRVMDIQGITDISRQISLLSGNLSPSKRKRSSPQFYDDDNWKGEQLAASGNVDVEVRKQERKQFRLARELGKRQRNNNGSSSGNNNKSFGAIDNREQADNEASVREKRKNIALGQGVKVRFAGSEKQNRKQRKRTMVWYHGKIAAIKSMGSKIHIKYDDGTKEWTSYPDNDIELDNNEATNKHESSSSKTSHNECTNGFQTTSSPEKADPQRAVSVGQKVKVRFETLGMRSGKTLSMRRWYKGEISRVTRGGSRLFINFVDGTSEWCNHPDDDIVILGGVQLSRDTRDDALSVKESENKKECVNENQGECVKIGHQVKVRFLTSEKQQGGGVERLRWYNGVVAKIASGGSKLFIKFDDGTSEWANYPDNDVVLLNKNKSSEKVLDQSEVSWQKNFVQMKAFKKKYGDCDVSAENDLSLWVALNRVQYKEGALSPKSTKKLNSIGFSWNIRKRPWGEMFEALKDFYEKHGHTEVPKTHTPKGLKLYRWAIHMRFYYRGRKLQEDKIEALESVSFDWRELKQRITNEIPTTKSTNHLRVVNKPPSQSEYYSGEYESSLKEDEEDVKKKVGIQPIPPHTPENLKIWEESYRRLLTYRAKTGNCNVPYVYASSPKLGRWVSQQRRLNTQLQLNTYQKTKLKQIGFDWKYAIEIPSTKNKCSDGSKSNKISKSTSFDGAESKKSEPVGRQVSRGTRHSEKVSPQTSNDSANESLTRRMLLCRNSRGDSSEPARSTPSECSVPILQKPQAIQFEDVMNEEGNKDKGFVQTSRKRLHKSAKDETFEMSKKKRAVTKEKIPMGDVWVECDRCLKWRRLPGVQSESELPSVWLCYMNKSDPKRSVCTVPEEGWSIKDTSEPKDDIVIVKRPLPKHSLVVENEPAASESSNDGDGEELSADSLKKPEQATEERESELVSNFLFFVRKSGSPSNAKSAFAQQEPALHTEPEANPEEERANSTQGPARYAESEEHVDSRTFEPIRKPKVQTYLKEHSDNQTVQSTQEQIPKKNLYQHTKMEPVFTSEDDAIIRDCLVDSNKKGPTDVGYGEQERVLASWSPDDLYLRANRLSQLRQPSVQDVVKQRLEAKQHAFKMIGSNRVLRELAG